MKYEIMPVIWIGDLEDALKAHYGKNFLTPEDDLHQILFDDRFCNDVSVKLDILEVEEWDESLPEWVIERQWRIKRDTQLFLQSQFPGQTEVMIDVSW